MLSKFVQSLYFKKYKIKGEVTPKLKPYFGEYQNLNVFDGDDKAIWELALFIHKLIDQLT